MVLKNETQTGAWSRVYGHNENAPVKKNVFSLWFDHGVKPHDASYEYIIVPGIEAAELAKYAGSLPVKILANTPDVQAVSHPELKIVQAAFYAPGTLTIRDGLIVNVSHACLLLLRQSGPGRIAIAIANPDNPPSRPWRDDIQQFSPTHSAAAASLQIDVEISMPLRGDRATQLAGGKTRVSFPLPTGMMAGQSVIRTLDAPGPFSVGDSPR